MISQGVKVLIVQALDSEGVRLVVAPAHQAGIKVIAYDRLVRNGDLDYYITFDSVKVGEVEAKFVVAQAPKGNYIWLGGGPEDFNAHLISRARRTSCSRSSIRATSRSCSSSGARAGTPKRR